MLQQILKDMYIDPELLAELPEDQKQYLFFKMREEQVRRWNEWEKELEKSEEEVTPVKHSKKNGKKVDFVIADDGNEWVWVMGDHVNDKSIEQILEEEAEQKAIELAEQEIRKELEQEKEEKLRREEQKREFQEEKETTDNSPAAGDIGSTEAGAASEAKPVISEQLRIPDEEEEKAKVEASAELEERKGVEETPDIEAKEEIKVEETEEKGEEEETAEKELNGEEKAEEADMKEKEEREVEEKGEVNGEEEEVKKKKEPQPEAAEKRKDENGTENKPAEDVDSLKKRASAFEGVQLRSRPALSEEEQLKKMIMRRSREILFDFKSVRARFEQMAKKDAKELDRQFRSQEEKARAVEEEIRQVRLQVRQEKAMKPVAEALMAMQLLQAKPSFSPADDVTDATEPTSPPSVSPAPPQPVLSKAEVKRKEKEEKKKKEELRKREKEAKRKKDKEKSGKSAKHSPQSPTVEPLTISLPPDLSPSLSSPKPPVPPRPRITRRPANREAASNWFLRVQKPRGATIDPNTHAVAVWFHGLITRSEAESVLEEEAPGSFLLRISERLFGYAVSVRDCFHCKHFLIEALTAGGYRLFGIGEHRVHRTLFDFVEYHRTHPLTSFGQERLLHPTPRSDSDFSNEQGLYVELFPECPSTDVSSVL